VQQVKWKSASASTLSTPHLPSCTGRKGRIKTNSIFKIICIFGIHTLGYMQVSFLSELSLYLYSIHVFKPDILWLFFSVCRPSTSISQIDTTTGKGAQVSTVGCLCFVFFYFNFYFNWNNIIPRSSHELTTELPPSKDLLMEFVCLARNGYLPGFRALGFSLFGFFFFFSLLTFLAFQFGCHALCRRTQSPWGHRKLLDRVSGGDGSWLRLAKEKRIENN